MITYYVPGNGEYKVQRSYNPRPQAGYSKSYTGVRQTNKQRIALQGGRLVKDRQK